MAPNNRKVEKTQAAIQAALIQIIDTQGLNKLTVAGITHLAHINRSTFYHHYIDKYDLVEKTEQGYLTLLNDSLDRYLTEPLNLLVLDSMNSDRLTHLILQMTTYIDQGQNFDLARVLTGPKGDPAFVVEIKTMIQRHLALPMETQTPEGVPASFIQDYILDGILSIVLTWLQSVPRLPVTTVTNMLLITRFQSTSSILARLQANQKPHKNQG
ncbi:TetR/AcrR family transcriptional regulator [Levilactobacillus bambusae]|uniref:HTH tetR-type domain-containing protein n=1 Tax=Levilactobacillus bambusae TaxID=2024736 RepID=A0A2V1MYX6_9LACO|nr:TetR/AcrR family transcriptional regulator [Levilactobacillus bambusae]PWG00214.1 hypothetical protein DCM90_04580 [Levilactobacillus bambusae]